MARAVCLSLARREAWPADLGRAARSTSRARTAAAAATTTTPGQPDTAAPARAATATAIAAMMSSGVASRQRLPGPAAAPALGAAPLDAGRTGVALIPS